MAADSDSTGSYYALLGVSPTASAAEIKQAYRQLATTLHPDKVANTAHHDQAATLFSRMQEAYEVLSDPQKRDIYDIYGKEGLAAGLEVGDRLKTRDELRAEWEAFQSKQRKEVMEAQVNYRGMYVFKVDATALVRPYKVGLARLPELTSIYMTSGLDVPLESRDWGWLGSEQDAAHLGGMVNVRRDVGGGSFLAGYKRQFADYSSLQLTGAVGLRTLLTAQHTVQLSPDSTASLVASWQPNVGVGVQFVSTRQLTANTSGEYSWVVGPPEAAGMSLGLTRRTEKLMLSARVEVGAMTALVLRGARQLSSAATARLGLKLTPVGVEFDLGGTKRFSEVATAGCGVAVGLQGITLKLRYNRAGHLFEFPVLLSSNPLDWPVLAAAYLLPPLVYLAGRDLVVGPLQQGVEARRARFQRSKQAAVIREALGLAGAAAELMLPVARRRVERERAAGGLVVVLALYGEEEAVLQAARGAPQRMLGGTTAASAAAGSAALPPPQPGAAQQGAALPEGIAAAAPPGQSAGSDGGGGSGEEVLPSPVADVTVAVQYLVESSKVVFHKGYPKSSLLGFCDPSPAGSKLLLVYYTYRGRPYRAQIGDSEGAQLPGRGALLGSGAEAEAVLHLADPSRAVDGGSLPEAPAMPAPGSELWRDNPSFHSSDG